VIIVIIAVFVIVHHIPKTVNAFKKAIKIVRDVTIKFICWYVKKTWACFISAGERYAKNNC